MSSYGKKALCLRGKGTSQELLIKQRPKSSFLNVTAAKIGKKWHDADYLAATTTNYVRRPTSLIIVTVKVCNGNAQKISNASLATWTQKVTSQRYLLIYSRTGILMLSLNCLLSVSGIAFLSPPSFSLQSRPFLCPWQPDIPLKKP